MECKDCSRHKSRRRIVLPEIHLTKKVPDLFVLGESPGRDEDKTGKPFVGRAGQPLRAMLKQITDNYIIDNTVRCLSEAKPNEKQVGACRPKWKSIVAKYKPKLIIALGKYAAESIFDRKIKVSDVVGKVVEIKIGNTKYKVMFNFHPSYILRIEHVKGGEVEKHKQMWFDVWDHIFRVVKGVEKLEMSETPKVNIITNQREIISFIYDKLLKTDDLIAYDYETSGETDARRPELNQSFKILTIGVGVEGQGYSFPFNYPHRTYSTKISDGWVKVITGKRCVAQYSKYEHKCNLKVFGRTNYLYDTALASSELNELHKNDLASICIRCGIKWSSYKLQSAHIAKAPLSVSLAELCGYNALDGLATRLCWDILFENIKRKKRTKGLEIREWSSVSLSKLEMRGMHINPSSVATVTDRMQGDLEAANESLREHKEVRRTEKWALANIKSFKKNPHFNAKSHDQVKRLILDELKIKIEPVIKKGKKTYNLDKKILATYEEDYPVIVSLLEVRSMNAMFTGFLNKWEEFLGPTGCVHTKYNQDTVVTSRLSSSDPNLQNIPRDSIVKIVFDSRFPGGFIIVVDYIQLEPRLLAGWSGDKGMCRALNEGLDLHRYVASQIFSVDYDDVTPKQRYVGKRQNLGQMYGQTPYGLSKEAHIPLEEAEEIQTEYNRRFADVKNFRRDFHAKATKFGIVKDLFGSVRHVMGAKGSGSERNRALRQASNFPIQSTGNKFCLIGLSTTDEMFVHSGLKAMVIGTSHDSIYVDCPKDELSEVLEIVKKGMLVHNHMSYWKDSPVPMAVDIKYGKNLYELGTWKG